MCAFALERMYGVFQLNRYAGPPCRDCGLIDARSFGAQVVPHHAAVLALGVDQVRVVRVDAAHEAVAAVDGNHVLVQRSAAAAPMLGSPQQPLSCSPPYTQYGFFVQTATW